VELAHATTHLDRSSPMTSNVFDQLGTGDGLFAPFAGGSQERPVAWL
jgi:hypothetical protein